MRKYIIKKGAFVHLSTAPAFDDNNYDSMTAEQDMVFTEDDRFQGPVSYYYYFRLPENDRGYKSLSAIPSFVMVRVVRQKTC